MQKFKLWARRLVLVLSILIAVGILGLLGYQHFSDGPTGPLMGGTFSSGTIVDAPVEDWSELAGDFEFELTGQGSSRTAGGVLVDGELYITCDLGFIWSRLPAGFQRNMLNIIWLFKTWHEEALLDGRIRIRKDGRLYPAVLTKVEDPVLIEKLKVSLETLANEFFQPDGIGPRPSEEPNDIWFFHVSQ